jgi:hypothetical protein
VDILRSTRSQLFEQYLVKTGGKAGIKLRLSLGFASRFSSCPNVEELGTGNSFSLSLE